MCNVNVGTSPFLCEDTKEVCNCCLECRNNCSWERYWELDSILDNLQCDKQIIDIHRRNKKGDYNGNIG